MKTARTHARGFTLVELLVVLTIIGLLMALLIPAVNMARKNAQNSRIALEISGLEQALQEYKQQSGDYPPNFNDTNVVNRHLSKRFQRLAPTQKTANSGDSGVPQFAELLVGGTHAMDPAEALVFWLGGQSPAKGSFKGGGLRNNPVQPLQPYAGTGEPKIFFNFDQGRLTDIDNDGWLEYGPPGGEGTPYVYFDNRSYAYYTPAAQNHIVKFADETDARGVVAPYQQATTPVGYVNPTTFQIHSAGLDGRYRTAGSPNGAYPSGPYDDYERDNITNFTEGSTLQDRIE